MSVAGRTIALAFLAPIASGLGALAAATITTTIRERSQRKRIESTRDLDADDDRINELLGKLSKLSIMRLNAKTQEMINSGIEEEKREFIEEIKESIDEIIGLMSDDELGDIKHIIDTEQKRRSGAAEES